MKLVKILGHPIMVMSVYLLLLIEGENFGGFYLLYLLLALPHGALYALLAASGLLCVFMGYKVSAKNKKLITPVLYLFGLGQMILSLVLFFGKGNKWDTFKQALPLISFIGFGFCCLCFLLQTFAILFNVLRAGNTTLKTI